MRFGHAAEQVAVDRRRGAIDKLIDRDPIGSACVDRSTVHLEVERLRRLFAAARVVLGDELDRPQADAPSDVGQRAAVALVLDQQIVEPLLAFTGGPPQLGRIDGQLGFDLVLAGDEGALADRSSLHRNGSTADPFDAKARRGTS